MFTRMYWCSKFFTEYWNICKHIVYANVLFYSRVTSISMVASLKALQWVNYGVSTLRCPVGRW